MVVESLALDRFQTQRPDAIRNGVAPFRRGKLARSEYRPRGRHRPAARACVFEMADRVGAQTVSRSHRRVASRRSLPAYVPLDGPARFLPDDTRRLSQVARRFKTFSRAEIRRDLARSRL